MSSPLSLQLSLFRSQRAKIARSVAQGSGSFLAYQARYRRRTRAYQRAVPLSQVHRAVAAADVVYVGDYHTLRAAQDAYLAMVERALGLGRRVVLALEFVEGRHQPSLDAFLEGRLKERTFLARIGHPYRGGYDIWPGFRPLLELARERKLEVRAIDLRAGGPSSLARRDLYAAARVAKAAAALDRPLVMVLMGEFHVAPCHLPREVDRALGAHKRRSLVVYQNCESIWWTLAKKRRAGRVEAVRIRPGELCLVHTSPLLSQQSFLDYLEAEAGDAPLGDGAQARFEQMARLVGRFAGVEVGPHLRDVRVLSPADPRPLEQLGERGRLLPRELAALRRHILSRESCYVPKARAAYLASGSLNHAAEEAAHFVRHCAVGEAMAAPRRQQEAFYARCVEEALGFFGSRLVNPRRACRSLEAWAEVFASRRGEERQIAAFLLAHKATEAGDPEAAATLIPLRQERLFHAVSHALGYLLGDALHRGFEAGAVSRKALRALFADPLVDPRRTYLELVATVRAFG